MNPFRLQPVGEESVGALLSLYEQCEGFLSLGPEATASLEIVIGDLANSRKHNATYLGIFDQAERLVGVVDFIANGHKGRSSWGCISLLMLVPTSRGNGLGTEVTRAVEDEILGNPGVTEIHLGVQVNNPGGLRFWRRLGYQITGGPERMPDTTTVYHLKKERGAGDQ